MLHPSIESTSSPVVIVEQPAALSRQVADSLRESAIAVSPRTREEERPSPVCAAGWAY
jgi:hypothetical protein